MSEIHPFALDLHHLHPYLGPEAAVPHRPCLAPVHKAGAGCESLSVLLWAVFTSWGPAVCKSSDHGWATPDLTQSKNKKQFIGQKMPFLRQAKADGRGKAGNKEKE